VAPILFKIWSLSADLKRYCFPARITTLVKAKNTTPNQLKQMIAGDIK
jgi:hypothetical protein